jgi:hypothetical protein
MCPHTQFTTISILKKNTLKLGYNEHSVITNNFLSKIGHISTQINPVITNPGYSEQKCPVPSCSL